MNDPSHEPGPSEPAGSDAGRRVVPVARNVSIALRDPVVSILFVAAFFDGISGNPPHAIVLSAVAVALGRDAVARRRAGGEPAGASGPAAAEQVARLGPEEDARAQARRLIFVPLALLAIVSYGVVVGGFARYSWPITFAIVIPAAAVLVLSWNGSVVPRPDPGPIGTVGAVAWLSVFVGLCLWELIELLLQPTLTTDSYAHPTLSVLSDPILATHPGRTVGLILWALFGWFLLRR